MNMVTKDMKFSRIKGQFEKFFWPSLALTPKKLNLHLNIKEIPK